jgi:hypothetical protein
VKAVLILALAIMPSLVFAGKKPKDPKDWTGHKISEMVESHGPPSTVYDDPETKLKIFVWNSEKIINLGGEVRTHDYGYGVTHQTVDPGQSIVKGFYVMFWVTPEGVIQRWEQGKRKR